MAAVTVASLANATSTTTLMHFKSRRTLLTWLDKYHGSVEGGDDGYDITPYANFTMNDINSMLIAEPDHKLNMHLRSKATATNRDKQVYVAYHTLTSKLSFSDIEKLYVNKLYGTEHGTERNVSTFSGDNMDLIIVSRQDPNETLLADLVKLWEKRRIYVRVVSLERLQFNLMEHVLVPPHRVLTDDEAAVIRKQYNVTSDSQLPDISRFSPVSQAIGIRPGQMCEIIRPSKTALQTKFYRICSGAL